MWSRQTCERNFVVPTQERYKYSSIIIYFHFLEEDFQLHSHRVTTTLISLYLSVVSMVWWLTFIRISTPSIDANNAKNGSREWSPTKRPNTWRLITICVTYPILFVPISFWVFLKGSTHVLEQSKLVISPFLLQTSIPSKFCNSYKDKKWEIPFGSFLSFQEYLVKHLIIDNQVL